MCATSRLRVLVPAASALLVSCVANPAPRGFLPTAEHVPSTAVGGWIEVTHGIPGADPDRVSGELLAVSDDSLWIATDAGARSIASSAVHTGRLWGWNAQHGQIGSGALLGVVSTISNGAFLVFTAPMWIIGGSAAAGGQSKLPVVELPASVNSLRTWSRFPGGLPPGIDLAAMRPVSPALSGGA